MKYGDSGSWVIREAHGAQEVIGHVVATDCLSQAYIMPLHDTFGDMERRLGADSIHLTTTNELEAMVATPAPSLFGTENVNNWLLDRETIAQRAFLDSFARYN